MEAIDRIVERLEREEGRFSALLMGVIESAPFQKRRNSVEPKAAPKEKDKKTSLLPGDFFEIPRFSDAHAARWPMLSGHSWVHRNGFFLVPQTSLEPS